MKQHTERLGTEPLVRLLIALSLPGVVSSITTTLYNIVDTIWVGRIGHEAIAALTIIFPYQILFYAIGGGTGIGISALVSRRFGERNVDAANRVAGQIFFISAFWGFLFMMVAVFFADDILPLIGATPDIMEYSKQYLVITSYGAPVMILAMLMSSLFRGSGDAVKPMIIMITGTVINVILDPFMILGIGPFPEMGVRGAAWATFIAQACGASLGLLFIFAGKTSFHIRAAHIRPVWSIIRGIYRVGAPTAVFQVTESVVFFLMNTVIASFGSVAIAALGLAIRVFDLAYMPIIGVSNGLLPIIGFCFGAGNYKRLWQAVKKAIGGISVLLLAMTIIIEIFTPQIVGIFSKEPELLSIAITAMRISMTSMVLVGLSVLSTTAFQGLARGNTALLLSLIRQFIVFLPLLYLCRWLWGLNGVWISWPIADVGSALVSYVFVYREYRIHQRKGYLPVKK
jgi:putative MATE family efflux protein